MDLWVSPGVQDFVLHLHFDMETQDPDDVFTLALAATHPKVNLIGVTCTPGGCDQVGLVKFILSLLGKPYIPVGGNDTATKRYVSSFHDNWLGRHYSTLGLPSQEVLKSTSHATLLTGGPLKNFATPSGHPVWVAQGGFAGDQVVKKEWRLPQFEGRDMYPTFNFNGARNEALGMLSNPAHEKRLLVSKNVCHGVVWNQMFHEKVRSLTRRTAGLELVLEGMTHYLQKKPEGKKLHDPLALACAIDPSVCTFVPVEVYREASGWGSRLSPDSRTSISVNVDHEKFFEVLVDAGD